MITASGIGSGLDVEGIISQLMELERQPQQSLQSKRQRLDVELSAFGSVKSAMSELSTAAGTLGDANSFGSYLSESSDEAVFTASASGSAAAAAHDIEVITLASTMRVTGDAYASADTAVDSGTWRFGAHQGTPDVTSFELNVGAGEYTVTELRDVINEHADNDFMTASVLNTDAGAQLVFTAKGAGTDNAISVDQPSGNPVTVLQPATDSVVEIDGLTVTSGSNSVTGAIEGVTLELVGVGTGSIETRRDTESLRENMDEFVTQYNALRDKLTELSEGELQGDRLPRDAELRLRSVFSLPVSTGSGQALSPLELGFTFDRYGALSVDEARLVKAQEEGLDRFVEFFTESDGFGSRVVDALDEFTRADGLIGNREDGIDSRRDTLTDQIDRFDFRLEQVEARYRRQFSAMDSMVSQLQSTGQYLAQRLGTNG